MVENSGGEGGGGGVVRPMFVGGFYGVGFGGTGMSGAGSLGEGSITTAASGMVAPEGGWNNICGNGSSLAASSALHAEAYNNMTGVKAEGGLNNLTGAAGDTGLNNITGVRGETGLNNLTGVKAEGGLNNLTGVKAEGGLNNLTGVKAEGGLNNLTGVKADAGVNNLTGVKGDAGSNNVTGVQGDAGNNNITGQKIETTTPRGDAAPNQDTVKPADNAVKPADNTVKPADNTVKPADNTVKPADNTDTKEPRDTRPVDGKEQPKITLVDASSAQAKNADVTIKADGRTEPPNVGDLFKDGKPHKGYVVAIEKGAKESDISDTLSAMKGYIQSKGDENTKYSPSLVDNCKETQISADLKKTFEKEPEEEPKTNIPKGDTSQGGGNSNPPKIDENDKETPDTHKDDPREEENGGGDKLTPKVSDYKSAFGVGDYANGAPHSLGKYGMDAGKWFMGSCLTDGMMAELMEPPPGPHWEKLKDVLKKHQNDPEFAAKMKEQGQEVQDFMNKLQTDDKFASGFSSFLQNQQEGKTATPEEMSKYFSPQLQDAAFDSQMSKLAKDMKIDLKSITPDQVQDLAVAFKLGHAPTAAEKQGDAYRMISDYAKAIKERMQSGVVPEEKPNPKK